VCGGRARDRKVLSLTRILPRPLVQRRQRLLLLLKAEGERVLFVRGLEFKNMKRKAPSLILPLGQPQLLPFQLQTSTNLLHAGFSRMHPYVGILCLYDMKSR
jgi:hypothetical protein